MLLATGAVEAGDGRPERAAEIPSTSPNHQAIALATSGDLFSTAVPSEAPSAASTERYNVTEAPSTTSSSTEGTVTSIGEQTPPVDEASSISSTEPGTSTTTAETTTTVTSTTIRASTASTGVVTGGNSAEYFADDHAASVAEDRGEGRLSNGSSTEKTVEESTTRLPLGSEFASRASAAVGRVLAQEESVPWPEAKSTKVIGTIIEDVQSPLQSDRQESITAAALTGSAIAAIVLCAFLVVVTTAGEWRALSSSRQTVAFVRSFVRPFHRRPVLNVGASGYWWYRRRYSNRPETLNDRYAASEAGGNGDDIFRVGYIHSPEMPRVSRFY